MGKSEFEKLLEKATSSLLVEPEWDAIMSICDCIRQATVKPAVALEAMKRKITQDNTFTAKYALLLLECVMKNCGPTVHDVVATKEFMEFMRDLCKTKPEVISSKVLELLQAWAHAFRNENKYRVIPDTYNIMKMEGHNFPTLNESDAMFATEIAPKWKENDSCYNCEDSFTVFNRRHHCRSCGESFCGKCSSKSAALPKFFIDKAVRVCDRCYDAAKGKTTSSSKSVRTGGQDRAAESAKAERKSEEDAQREEEDLQLALALSQSEADAKKEQRERMKLTYVPNERATNGHSNTGNTEVMKMTAPTFEVGEGISPELARYLNRNYWEKKSNENAASTTKSSSKKQSGGSNTAARTVTAVTQPSAPEGSITSSVSSDIRPVSTGGRAHEHYQNGGVTADSNNVYEEIEDPEDEQETPEEEEEFLRAVSSSIDVFVNRMRSDHQRGRSIANDSAVQTLFSTLEAMRPKLVTYVHRQEDSRAHLESLQDKLTQLKDAREALTALREEHAERKRREHEERERLRQIQMAQKLEIMRQKKQEYLQYQRQLALQKMEEQKRAMAMRLEQQKQMTAMRQMQLHGFPAGMTAYLPNQISTDQQSSVMLQSHQYNLPQPGVPYTQQTNTFSTAPSTSALGNPQYIQSYGPGVPPQGPGVPPHGPGVPPQGPGVPPQGPGVPPQGPGVPPQGPGGVPQGPGTIPQGYQQTPSNPPFGMQGLLQTLPNENNPHQSMTNPTQNFQSNQQHHQQLPQQHLQQHPQQPPPHQQQQPIPQPPQQQHMQQYGQSGQQYTGGPSFGAEQPPYQGQPQSAQYVGGGQEVNYQAQGMGGAPAGMGGAPAGMGVAPGMGVGQYPQQPPPHRPPQPEQQLISFD